MGVKIEKNTRKDFLLVHEIILHLNKLTIEDFMKKKFLLFAIGYSTNAFTQSLTPDVISSSGSTFTDGISQLDWTLGEPATFTFNAGSTLLTQGFHQPNLLITAVSDEEESLMMNIFPNPVIDEVQLQFSTEAKNITIELMNAEGKTLSSQNITNVKSFSIDMQTLPSGNYLLSVTEKSFKTKTYKIIKLK